MNKTTLNSQEEKYSMLSLRRATFVGLAAHRLRNISIHALLAESDIPRHAFNKPLEISIHALLAESDYISANNHVRVCQNFYPRSPCGERHGAAIKELVAALISIHALLAESDPLRQRLCVYPAYFYPRSPCGERLEVQQFRVGGRHISIHALLAESDLSFFAPWVIS